jgi:Ca2+-transporting ATPase
MIADIKNNSSWFNNSAEAVLKALDSSALGLFSSEVKIRLTKFGLNEFKEEKKDSPIMLFIGQFKSLLILILVAAAVISIINGKELEAIAIMVIVLLAGILGFIQEYKAGKAIESLKKLAAPNAHVIREGVEKIIPTSQIVPGDIILIKMGDRIPADSRIIEAINLKIDEAALTGESLPVEKISKEIIGNNIPLGDRKNMLYMGTAVSYGRGKAVVVSTGMETEFGKIAGLLQSTENRKTPLQENLDQLGKKIGIFAIILATIMSLVGVLRNYPIDEMFVWGVALAVAVIPEALPAVVTISLALGVRRMVTRKALIRKLPAVETLGATTIICSDKTGTLTQDEMTIRKIFSGGEVYSVSGAGYAPEGEFFIGENKINPSNNQTLIDLLKYGSICNDTILKNENNVWDVIGDPTEGSIIVAAEKAGIKVEPLRKENIRIDEIPFSSERKKMTTINSMSGVNYALSKGATEVIIDSCTFIKKDNELLPLTDEERHSLLDTANSFAKDALRVLAIAYKKLPDKYDINSVESEMIFAGLVGMIDPPRPEVKDAIAVCESAGIKPIMITGDHKVTAIAIAKELGIMKYGSALSGEEIDKLTEEEFLKSVNNTDVYARISPSHKLKIVDALIKKNNVVAMTGDGVNDAPALKKADIGVAMGITGTDVSKEAADMILTDDNFTSIVAAVEEGRGIFENIRKYLVFLLSGNIGKVLGMIISLLAGLPLPLFAVQILFLNFLMDGLIAIALGVEPPEPGIMKNKPRNVQEGILNKFTLWWIGIVGVLIAIVSMAVYTWALQSGYDEKEAMTIFFLTMIFSRLFNGFNVRSLEQSIFKLNFFGNKSLIFGSIAVLVLTAAVMSLESLRNAFHISLLNKIEWLGVIVASLLIFILVEIMKVIKHKLFFK